MKKKCNSGGLTRIRLRKMLLTMKFLCFFFLLSISVSAASYSQEARLTLSADDVPLTDVFSMIRKNSEFTFIYNVSDVKSIRVKSLNVKDATIREVLDFCLKGTGYSYTVEDQVVVIQAKDEKDKKKSMTLRGWVRDTKKEPLPGVTVRIVGVSVGTSTNEKGWFSIQMPVMKGKLEFSFVGFKKKQIDFTEKTDTLRVVLEEDISDLDEVTVIAYGERNKREVVSSISSVKGDEIKEIPTSSFVDLLQGRMAGVQISSQSGSPGGGGTFVAVRGYNSLMQKDIPSSDGQPLYVIDGIPMHSFTSPITGTNALAELDPSTIESVEVLKDAAAAAIYGSRAGNGVILITTKKGKIGKATFSANVSYSASVLPRFPYQLGGREERWWHILYNRNYKEPYTGADKVICYPTSYQDAYTNRGKGAQYDAFWNAGNLKGTNLMLQDSLNPFYNNQTNWWKKLFRTGEVVNANIQASGGTATIRYMVGMGYYTEKGIMFGSDFKRANFIANLSTKPAKRISFDSRFYLAYTDKSRNTKNNSFASSSSVESMTADPRRTSSLLPAGGAVEDQILKELNGIISRDDSYRMMLNAMLGIDFIEGLKFTASLGLDYNQNNSNVFEPSYLSTLGNNKSTGIVDRNIGITQENLLRYTRNINDVHRFEVLLGLTYTENQRHLVRGYGERGASDDIHYVDGNHPDKYVDASGVERTLKNFQSEFTQQVMVSYLGRIAYNYKLKYLMEFTYRRDGSSAFGEDVRYANFPSIAVGWSFGEESFVKSWAHWLDMGKIRGSWGTSGQTLSDPYLAHGVIEVGKTFMGNQGAFAPMINRNLSWEKSDQYDIGLDMDMFNYRLKVKLDYYYKYTKSLLYNMVLPGDILGNQKQWRNAMEISNQGIELELVADIIRGKDWSWRTRFNISRNWNCFEKSYNGIDIDRLVIGRPLNGIYVYDDRGIYQNVDEVPTYVRSYGRKYILKAPSLSGKQSTYTAGMRVIRDLDGNGLIGDGDLYYAGSTLPVASGGWVHEVKWKNLDLNVLFAYTLGRKMMNQYAQNSLYTRDPLFTDYRDYSFWQGEGDYAADMSAVGFMDIENVRSRLEKVNYLRLRTLSVGYNVPSKVSAKVGVSGIRVFFTGENLFLWDNYSGLDPEIVGLDTGMDNLSNYPLARKFTLGLTVKF